MINMERAYWPIKKWKFVPIFEAEKVKGTYLKNR
jgi:hypothetical protein